MDHRPRSFRARAPLKNRGFPICLPIFLPPVISRTPVLRVTFSGGSYFKISHLDPLLVKFVLQSSSAIVTPFQTVT